MASSVCALDDLSAWISGGEESVWQAPDSDDDIKCPHLVQTSGDEDNTDDMSVDEEDHAHDEMSVDKDCCSHAHSHDENLCLGDLIDFRTADGLWRTGRIVDRDSRQITIESRCDGNFIFHNPSRMNHDIAPAESMVEPPPSRLKHLKYGDSVEINVQDLG